MIKNIIYKSICKILLPKGYSDYFSGKIVSDFKNDFLKNKKTTLTQKIWAYKRGFLSNKIELFGLNDSNYMNFISDIDYYMIHPINREYSKWIDDKLTTKYMLKEFSKYLTKYYFQLENNKIIKLMDCPKEIKNSNFGIIDLLKREKALALKLLGGSLGLGFYKISYDGSYYINNQKVLKEDIFKLIESLNNYIVTEYISCHDRLAKIYDKAPNTLRVMTIQDKLGNSIIVRGVVRFGTNKSGVIEHAHAGGIYANIDIKTGEFYDGRSDSGKIKCSVHPDSGESLEGVIPNWNIVKEKIIQICNYMPQLSYMGWDIVITNDGFRILEINSHQSLDLHQWYRGIYEDSIAKEFFQDILKKYKK